MEKFLHGKKLLPSIVLAGSVMLAACVNNDYDLNEVDTTIGVGGDEILFPTSSTDTIRLVDVLELDESGCVVVRPNGDYMFEQRGGEVSAAHPRIERITVAKQSALSHDMEISVGQVSGAKSFTRGVSLELKAEGDVVSFAYEGNKPDDVVALDKAAVDANVSLRLKFPDGLSSVVSTIDELSVELPAYMTLGSVETNATCAQDGSKLTFTSVPTNRDLTLSAAISELDFAKTSELGQLTVDGGKIKLDGKIHARLNSIANVSSIGAITSPKVTSTFTISDFTIKGATGRFNPSIDLSDLGSVEVTGVPDFLTDGNVVVDLYNPQILLTLNSDMSVEGLLGGVLESKKNGVTLATVTVPEMRVKAGGTTTICICRRAEGVAGTYDVTQEVANLSELIKTIPDKITFSATARTDAGKTCEFELGRTYTVQPEYRVEAPIMFDEDASIVYTDSLDDWNKDVKDFDFADSAYVNVTANVENRVPAYLKLTVNAMDIDGNVMNPKDISVEVNNTIIASADGENSVTTPLDIKLKQGRAGALKRLDGLVFRVEANATEGAEKVVGKTLNSQKHFLIAKDVKIKLVGKIIADLN